MPSVSEAQHNLMEASAHGAKWAQKKVKPSVAREFVEADKSKTAKESTASKIKKRYKS